MSETNGQQRTVKEHLFKILVIGDLGTGKTSFIKRYVHQTFSAHYRATIGVDFALKVIEWDPNTVIRLQLWDIAGQERFGQMTRVYYKEAIGCFIVYDVTRRATFESAVKWKKDLDAKVRLSDGHKIPCVLLGNKCDELDASGAGCSDSNMNNFCIENDFTGWYEVSALDGTCVDDSARFLVEEILKKMNLLWSPEEESRDGITLQADSKGGTAKSNCC